MVRHRLIGDGRSVRHECSDANGTARIDELQKPCLSPILAEAVIAQFGPGFIANLEFQSHPQHIFGESKDVQLRRVAWLKPDADLVGLARHGAGRDVQQQEHGRGGPCEPGFPCHVGLNYPESTVPTSRESILG